MAGAFTDRALVRVVEDCRLPLAADHRRVESAGAARCPCLERKQAVRAHRLALALELERIDRLDLHGIPDEPVRGVAEEDLSGRRRLLESFRDIDGIAGCEALAAGGVAGNDFAGVDAGADLNANSPVAVELLVELL